MKVIYWCIFNNRDEGSAHIIYLTCERSEVGEDMDKQQWITEEKEERSREGAKTKYEG